MAGRRATLVAILGVILVACSAEAQPTPSERASPDRSDGAPSTAAVTAPPTPVVAPSPTAEATLAPEPSPMPQATPTPRPAPPRPTGVKFDSGTFSICDDSSNPEFLCEVAGVDYTVRWKTPRSKGVQIRVYGVTVCFLLEDGSDERCLRKGTLLPPDTRVLLAKAPASKGTVSWSQDGFDGEDLCAAAAVDKNGTRYYSVVVQAQSATGRSSFAIADEGWYDDEDCAVYVVQPGDTLAKIADRNDVTVDHLIAANLSTLPDPNKLRVGSTILIPIGWAGEGYQY
jgi:hypothetical protein